MPDRIRLSRQKGWRMPENTVKVDRSTPLVNPFIAGTHGTLLECTAMYAAMIDGHFILGKGIPLDVQAASYHAIREAADRLAGKNLACWCTLPKPGEPDTCHARIMLELINHHPKATSHANLIIRAWQEQKKSPDLFIEVADFEQKQEEACAA